MFKFNPVKFIQPASDSIIGVLDFMVLNRDLYLIICKNRNLKGIFDIFTLVCRTNGLDFTIFVDKIK